MADNAEKPPQGDKGNPEDTATSTTSAVSLVGLGNVEDTEEESDEQPQEDEPDQIPDNFFYDIEPLLSKPVKSEGCELPDNVVTLYHSFGYNCRQRHNLHAIDQNRLAVSAGAYLEFIDLTTLHKSHIRTTGGGSVGAITVHPQGRLFAVGEKGEDPTINIFVITNLRLYRILRGGTTQAYNALTFNVTGELLASQGGDPDFMLTVWNWQQETILLRCKAFAQEVHHVSFNKDLVGWLTTSGSGHIKFWNMARTFTGLKLHGSVGRFGRTALSDIEGFVEFPDGKVLSGSEWGNMLLWDENLIKLQIGRKEGKPCHQGQIQQMLFVEGEILTAGMDGYVRCWNWEAIDQAEATEEGGLVEMKPMNEVLIGPTAQLYFLTKPPKVIRYEGDEAFREVEELPDVDLEVSGDIDSSTSGEQKGLGAVRDSSVSSTSEDDSSRHLWYCQDGAGCIWQAELSFLSAAKAPKVILDYHAGRIVACAVSPVTHLVMTLGEDGSVRLHDFLQKVVIAVIHFKAAGCCMVWVPLSVDHKCASVLCGFADGGIRLVAIDGEKTKLFGVDKFVCKLKLAQALKPHEKAVTSLAFDCLAEVMCTCGEDQTVFLFFVSRRQYIPMCFVPIDYIPRYLKFSQDPATSDSLLIVCDDGRVIEMIRPAIYEHTAVDSLQHHDVRYREFKFSSIKSQLRHDEELDVIRKEEEARQKAIEEDDRRLLEQGMETPSQQNLRKEQEREKAKIAKIKQEEEDKKKPQWKPYMPPHPSPILQVLYLESNARFWVSMGDYDAGYLYECELPRYYSHVANLDENDEGPSAKPVRAVPVADSDDVPIRVIRFNSEGTCAFFGMQNGRIRLQFLEVEFDLASPSFYWTIAAHDVTNGAITGMELSHDESFLMTVGDDGNFFIFSLLPITQLLEEIKEHKAKLPPAEPDFRPGVDLEPGQYTIEQAKQKTDYDRMVKEAEKNKSEKRITIAQLRARFRRLWLDNMQLPAQHRLTKDEFLMDEGRLREMREETEEKLREMKRQLAWDSEKAQLSYQKIHGRYRKHLTQDRFAVRAFLTDHVIWSYRTQDEPEEVVYEVAVEEEDDKLEQSRVQSAMASHYASIFVPASKMDAINQWEGVSQRTKNLLRDCERKRRKREARRKQWEVFMQTKPDDDYADPADLRAIQIAKDTIGDFKLKSSSDYIVPDSYKLTLRDARARLKTCEEHLLGLQTRFNQRLLALRDEKAEIVQDINGMIGRLKEISQDIAYKHFRQVPLTLRLTHDEQPENHFSFTKADLLDLKKRLAEEEKRRQEHEQAELGLTSPSAAQAATHQQQAKRRSSHVQRMSHPKLSRVHSVVAKISAPKKSVESSHEESVAETAEESSDSSDMLEELAEIDDIKLKYEQDTLHNTIRRKKLLFDIEHRLLRHEKFRLDLLAKMGDLRTTTLTEEKILMRDCESVETAIRTRISQSYEQKTEMERNLRQLKQNAEKQTSELDKCAKKEKALLAQLDAIIGEKNPFRDFLIKVYKKKIKRKPKKEGTEGEEGEEESSSESSSEDESEEEEDEDDDDQVFYDLSTCPQGCSQEKFDEVVQLRESRLDLDEQMLEFKRMRDGFLKETEGIKKKKIAVDFTLEKANKELGLFQTEKQKRVNSLDVLTLLQFHQLKCLRRHDMPPDLVELLNLNESDLFRLQNRIRELKQEMRIQKRNMFESRKLHAHLQYERRHFQEKLAEMSKICDDSMMKKLGKIVHMEILDNVVCDLELEEAKLKLSKSRKVCEEEIKLLDAEHKELVQDHTNLMLRIDSEMCLQKASLMDRHMTYTRNLDTMVSSMRMRYEDTQIKLPKDIEELISVIAQQRVALQALGREIDYLTNGPKPVMKRTDYD